MYFVALEGVTRYALSEAVKGVMRNKLGHTFFPSPVELRKLCDEAQAPHSRMAERIRQREQQSRENAEFNRIAAQKTPQVIARQQAVYRDFCERHSKQKAKEADRFGPPLDPELLAKVPDAPSTFEKLKWSA